MAAAPAAAAAAKDCGALCHIGHVITNPIGSALSGAGHLAGGALGLLGSVTGHVLGGVGSTIAGAVADAWTAAMLAVWDAGMWFLNLMLGLVNYFLTPDLSASGPMGQVYDYAFWLAGALCTLFIFVQLGIAAVQFNAKHLGRALVGTVKFLVIITTWVFYAGLIITAASGLTSSLAHALLGSDSLTAASLWKPFSTHSVADAATATVLAFLAIFLILSSLAVVFVYVARGAALPILVATAPIAAAGSVTEFGNAWFWKTFRWFHAAALSPVLMVLVMGIGTKLTAGVAEGLATSLHSAVAAAVPGVMIICMSAVAPMGLFKLLAFVEPGTPSGAAMRQGFAAQGGVQGLMSGGFLKGGQAGSAAGAVNPASEPGVDGGTQGEDQAQAATGNRFQKAFGQALPMLGKGMDFANNLGSKGLAMQADLDSQAGVGHTSHFPDWSAAASRGQNSGPSTGSSQGPDHSEPPPTGPANPAPTPPIEPPITPPNPMGPTPGGAPGAPAGGQAPAAGIEGAEGAALLL